MLVWHVQSPGFQKKQKKKCEIGDEYIYPVSNNEAVDYPNVKTTTAKRAPSFALCKNPLNFEI